jgi:hypothetical protein
MAIGRREFVGTTAFLFAGLGSAAAIRQEARENSDPVLEAILADFRELIHEGNERPAARRGAVRGFETLTSVLAAHLGNVYDANMKNNLRRQLRSKGRQALVHEITVKANRPEITHEGIDAMITRFEREGMAGVLRDVQNTLKRIRENLPPDYLQARAVIQYQYCSDLIWMIGILEFSAALACALAAGMVGLNPEADAACAGAQAGLAAALAMKWWYGC